MGEKPSVTRPRVVLDTNCVVSALIFSRGRMSWLREGWQCGRFTALINRETTTELMRVLHYPKFKLDRRARDALLADFVPHAETITIEAASVSLPLIRDKDDTKFLQLALNAGADALVSGDGDIQAVKAEFGVPILTVLEFAAWLNALEDRVR